MFSKSLNLKNSKNLTITGGMPFAGGPLNSYVIHSTVKMIENIRNKKKSVGVVTGVSGMMTKQSYALWAKEPITEFMHKDFTSEVQKKEQPIELSSLQEGVGNIIGYTTLYRTNPAKAIIYLNCEDGKRKLITSTYKSIIKSMEKKEWVKRRVYFKKNRLVY